MRSFPLTALHPTRVAPRGGLGNAPRMPLSRSRIAVTAALLLCRAVVAADTAPSPLAAEADRWLAASRQAPAGNPDLAGPRRDAERLLERAKTDLAAGRDALAFEDLARGRSLLRAFAWVDEHPAARTDLKAFERLWQERSVALRAEHQALRAMPWGETPGAVRAIAESAEGKIETLVEASRAYAAVTSPGDGLFYLGQAEAAAELARLGHTVSASAGEPSGASINSAGKPSGASITNAGKPSGTSITSAGRLSSASATLRSILPELRAIQDKVNAAFQPPLSIERHPDFIRLNATLKLAQELDAVELYAGALYQYLDAVQQLALLAVPASAEAPTASALRQRLADRGDTSIGELFLQRAEAVDATPAEARKPGDARTAQAIAEQVVPAYLAVLDRGPTVAPTVEKAAGVTVTLVRWPYT